MFETVVQALDAQGSLRTVRSDLDGNLISGSVAVARSSNPTASSAGAPVQPFYDDVGRQITVPYQMRDLVATARVTLTGGSGGNTETALRVSSSGEFSDLYQLTAVNTSTAALTAGSVQLDIREQTGGGITYSVMIPNDDSKPLLFNPPLPQSVATDTWTVQTPSDISAGTNIVISATFVRNV